MIYLGNSTDPNAPKILFLGDSHTHILKSINLQQPHLPKLLVQAVHFKGATARGLYNKEKRRSYGKIIREYLSQYTQKQFDIIFTQFGEVDCGFVAWVVAKRDNISIEESIKQSIQSYVNYTKEVISPYTKNVCLTGAALPTIIKNTKEYGEVSAERAELLNSIEERTALTWRYNELLKEAAEQNGFGFIDVSPYISDPTTGIILPEYRKTRKFDHHHGPNVIAPWLKEIRRYLNEKNIKYT